MGATDEGDAFLAAATDEGDAFLEGLAFFTAASAAAGEVLVEVSAAVEFPIRSRMTLVATTRLTGTMALPMVFAILLAAFMASPPTILRALFRAVDMMLKCVLAHDIIFSVDPSVRTSTDTASRHGGEAPFRDRIAV